jgi:chemotaxis signal transduction protein
MGEVVLVELGDRRLAVATARVREVAQVAALTPVPTAPPPVAGLTHLRGQILPVIDLAGPTPRPARPNDPLLVIELGAARAALLVDRVIGVAASPGEAELVDVAELFDLIQWRVAT